MIRKAELEDVGELARLMTVLSYPTTKQEMAVRFAKIKMKTDYQTYVYEENERLLGMIGMVHGFRYEGNDTYIRVVAVVVDEEHRGKGIGKQLFDQAEKWGKAKGAGAVILNSGNRPERAATHSVYEHWGFVKKSTGFAKPLKQENTFQ
ncbi:N-acetylglutamate synthase, GNAT family [Thalassobacillus cyri]|uniref:N-acetylglutamate synthase, GNAT family n=1 Tax=Thalassobacillus cyri TaxID=571932 RepID=A0A1H3Z045_9BACI|nr:GNAT family N-acetyltransferase [Thalassobacillus cyri]SEA16684.1 N-acetylglutamate synthase, GNAT family [Thalassobacillus cyri]